MTIGALLAAGVAVPPAPATLANQVEVYGGASAYSFGEAVSDAITPSGQTFRVFPSDWPLIAGAGPWFSVATADGQLAIASMTYTDNEVEPTMLGTALYIWNPATARLQCIPVPTTMGVFNPPGPNGATGTTIDQVRAVQIGGVNHVFAIGAFGYSGWKIATYGEPYWLMAFTETSPGEWSFNPALSCTASQLAKSTAAGALAFPTAVNSFGETYHQSLGPNCMALAPSSGDLLIGNYFYKSGLNSGSIVAVRPSTGVVMGLYQFPDVTDINSVPLKLSVRDFTVNPSANAGNERFIMTPDVFIRPVGTQGTMGTPGPPVSGTFVPGNVVEDSNSDLWYCIVGGTPGTWQEGNNYGLTPLMEFSYDGNGNFTLESPPMTPYTMPDIGYLNSYNLAQYDGDGNLSCPTHGGVGLGVFNGHETHVFLASGGVVPTFEGNGPAPNWYAGAAGQFPTVTKADFRLGSFGLPNGFDCSFNYDPTSGNMVLLTQGGILIGAALAASPAFGSELAINGGLTSGTTGFNGFFGTSTLDTDADSDFASGECLVLTSVGATQNIAAQSPISVTEFQNYILTAKVKGVTLAEALTAQMWWKDVNGKSLVTSVSPTVTMTSTGVLSIECLTSAPAGAVTGFLLFDIVAQSVGEQYKLGDVSLKSCPAVATNAVDTNKVRLTSGVSGSVFPNKGEIINGRLYSGVLDTSATYPADVGTSVPQWLLSIDLSALIPGPPAPPPPTPTAPGAPVLSSAKPGNASVALAWVAPSSNGGSPITSYKVLDNGTVIASGLSPTTLTLTVTGLTNGTLGVFTVEAVNSVGTSAASNPISATPSAPLTGVNVAQLATTGGPPGARGQGYGAFYPGTGLNYYFGGNRGPALSDTQSLDPVARIWKQITSASAPANVAVSIGYDPVNDELIMFGGDNESTWFNATYSMDPTQTNPTWTLLNPSTKPAARSGHSMFNDPVTGKLMMYGGNTGTPTYFDDLYEWSGTNWILISSALTGTARTGAFVATLSNGTTLIFGGGNSAVLNDTHIWNGTTCVAAHPATSPPARFFGGCALTSTGEALIYGGANRLSTVNSSDCWLWDGTNYTAQTPTGSTMGGLSSQAMNYHPPTGEIISAFGTQGATGNASGDINTVYVITVGAAPPPPPPPPPGTAIKGLYTGQDTLANAQKLATTLGMTLGGFSDFTDGTSYATIGNYVPPALPAGMALLLSPDLTANGQGLSTVASNLTAFTKLATTLLALTNAGHTVILRLGCEMDGSWKPWGTGANGNTAAQFNPACTLVINAMKAVNPALKFDFCCNTGTSSLAQLMVYYGPNGDALWDSVGGDHYMPPSTSTSNTFSAFANVIALAVARNKPSSVGEMGLNGVDVPTWINDAAQFINTPATAASRYGFAGTYTVAYWSYFSDDIAINSDITQFPNSIAAFKADF